MKTCASGHPCKHRTLGEIYHGCSYTDYCDFQLPRDSRTQPVVMNEPYQQCTCGTLSNLLCPIHGKR